MTCPQCSQLLRIGLWCSRNDCPLPATQNCGGITPGDPLRRYTCLMDQRDLDKASDAIRQS